MLATYYFFGGKHAGFASLTCRLWTTLTGEAQHEVSQNRRRSTETAIYLSPAVTSLHTVTDSV